MHLGHRTTAPILYRCNVLPRLCLTAFAKPNLSCLIPYLIPLCSRKYASLFLLPRHSRFDLSGTAKLLACSKTPSEIQPARVPSSITCPLMRIATQNPLQRWKWRRRSADQGEGESRCVAIVSCNTECCCGQFMFWSQYLVSLHCFLFIIYESLNLSVTRLPTMLINPPFDERSHPLSLGLFCDDFGSIFLSLKG